jgi:hypothetical protein
MTIDYTKASPLFKVKTLAACVRLFGISRKGVNLLSESGAEGGTPSRRPTIAIHQL